MKMERMVGAPHVGHGQLERVSEPGEARRCFVRYRGVVAGEVVRALMPVDTELACDVGQLDVGIRKARLRRVEGRRIE